VRLGGTCVLARVSIELVAPTAFAPRRGFVEVSVRIAAGAECGPHPAAAGRVAGGGGLSTTSGGGTGGEAIRLSLQRLLERLYKPGASSATGGGGGSADGAVAVDADSLCVLPGRSVWLLRLGVVVLNGDGNLTDAVTWAAGAAMLHFRRPEVTVRGDTVTLHPPEERDPVPLALLHVPLTVSSIMAPAPAAAPGAASAAAATGAASAAVHPGLANVIAAHGGRDALLVVVDPTAAEENAGTPARPYVSVAVNKELQSTSVLATSGTPFPFAAIKTAIRHAKLIAPNVRQVMDDAVAADHKRRQAQRLEAFQWARTRAGVSRRPRDEEKASA
jgi:exosome complex component RRP45